MEVLFVLFLQLCVLIITRNLAEIQSKHFSSCMTPNNKIGECIEIQKCLVFMDALRLRKNESFDFIRASQCGGPLTHPKVCCGSHDDYLNKRPKNKITQRNLFPKNCGIQSNNENRLFGGVQASFGEFPWMARLRHRRISDGLLSYGCSGFLISEKFVLTAAHCIRSKILEPLGGIFQVQLGEHNTATELDCEGEMCADPPQLLEADEPKVHPGYSDDNQLHNDIAIVPLKDPAKFTDFVYPICLSKTISQESMMWISGWGKTKTRRSSSIKLKTKVPRVDLEECIYLYDSIGVKILDSQVCAGGEAGKDACSGDSGGPLMFISNIIWYAEGIVSYGKGCGEKGWPGVYTSIPYHIKWIEKVMNQYLLGDEEKLGNRHTILIEEETVTWSW